MESFCTTCELCSRLVCGTLANQEAAMAIRDDGSYPRMDKLLHEAPTGDAKGDNALPLGERLLPFDSFARLVQ